MFNYQSNGSGCACCGALIVGVKFCGWAPGFVMPNSWEMGGLSSYAWNGYAFADVGPLPVIPLQAYVDNVNSYDMSSIPNGYMRLLQHDGAYAATFDFGTGMYSSPGTGGLTGLFSDSVIPPLQFGITSPCNAADGCFDPFFQGNPVINQPSTPYCACPLCEFGSLQPHFCRLVTSSSTCPFYIGCAFGGVQWVIRCQVVYATGGTSGAMVNYDWSPVPVESVSGDDPSIGVCGNMQHYMPQIGCGTLTAGQVLNIPIPESDLLTVPACLNNGVNAQPYLKANYWFAGDTCSDIP